MLSFQDQHDPFHCALLDLEPDKTPVHLSVNLISSPSGWRSGGSFQPDPDTTALGPGLSVPGASRGYAHRRQPVNRNQG